MKTPLLLATILALAAGAAGAADEDAKRLATKALEDSQRAVALAPANAKAHLNLARCYGRMTDYVGNKQKLEYSKAIRDETLKSIELDPTDDLAWHVLGRWHAGIAGVNPVLKSLAKLAYGTMPEAGYDEAVKCLSKASSLAPQRISHHSELARVYTAMGRRDDALKQWRTVLRLPSTGPEDDADRREAQAATGAGQPR